METSVQALGSETARRDPRSILKRPSKTHVRRLQTRIVPENKSTRRPTPKAVRPEWESRVGFAGEDLLPYEFLDDLFYCTGGKLDSEDLY